MTTEEALEFIDQKNSDSAPDAQEKVNSTEDIASVSEVANEKKDDTAEPTVTPKAEEVTNVATKADEKAKPKKSQLTPEQKRNYAFAKEKQKRREQKEYYESQLKELKLELDKYKGLSKEDFKGDDDAYIEYKLDQRLKAEQVKQLEMNNQAVQKEYEDLEIQRRMDNSFSTPEEKDEYMVTLEKYGPVFLSYLEKKGEDVTNTVLSTIDHMPQYPKVMNKLLKDGAAVDYITASTDPYVIKQRFYAYAKKVLKPKLKAKLPIIGKQVSNNHSISNSKVDWVSYLQNH